MVPGLYYSLTHNFIVIGSQTSDIFLRADIDRQTDTVKPLYRVFSVYSEPSDKRTFGLVNPRTSEPFFYPSSTKSYSTNCFSDPHCGRPTLSLPITANLTTL